MAQRGMISLDDRELKQFVKALRDFPRAYVLAVRGMLNTAAFQTRIEAQKKIHATQIVRARGKLSAPGSVVVERAKGGDVRRMRSITGSIAPYMADQEFGGTRVAGGKRGVPIPSRTASGEGRGTAPRKRAVRKPMKLGSISLSSRRNRPRSGALSRKRRAFIAVKVAQQRGDKFVFLDLTGRGQGIYRVRKKGIDLVYETRRRSVDIPKNPWLFPSVAKVRPRMPGIWKAELRRQLRRRRIKWHLA